MIGREKDPRSGKLAWRHLEALYLCKLLGTSGESRHACLGVNARTREKAARGRAETRFAKAADCAPATFQPRFRTTECVIRAT